MVLIKTKDVSYVFWDGFCFWFELFVNVFGLSLQFAKWLIQRTNIKILHPDIYVKTQRKENRKRDKCRKCEMGFSRWNERARPVICGNHPYGCLAAAQSHLRVPKNRFCFQNMFRKTRKVAKRLSLYASLFQWENKAYKCFLTTITTNAQKQENQKLSEGFGAHIKCTRIGRSVTVGKTQIEKKKETNFETPKPSPFGVGGTF